ncbi:MAG: DUF3488 domain-containing transglutaminase family protein [Candidatus Obscuribacterales bacterium]|nr:DUF3488 domain-containing transglutaminase family protein [Steroidobacteraceae bacterium]
MRASFTTRGLASIGFARYGRALFMNPGIESKRLFWAMAALAFAIVPHAGSLPLWITLLIIMIALWRVVIETLAWRLPPRWFRILVSFAAITSVAVSYRTLNGLDAGTSLLALMAAVKLLETRTTRDYTMLLLIGFVLLFAALLYRQELLWLPYILFTAWVLTATLLRLHQTAHTSTTRQALRSTGVMVLQALPVAILLFVFFPRLPGQFWALPARGAATTGLSDELSPGDISDLTISGAIAFRVAFTSELPPPIERYWRGPVLHDFDGRRWRNDRGRFLIFQPVVPTGIAYSYRVTFEPTHRNWLIALDVPTGWEPSLAARAHDWQLFSRRPITTVTSFDLQSHSHFVSPQTLPVSTRSVDTALPGDANPRAREFAQRLRAVTGSDTEYIQALLSKFRDEEYFYTLEPPTLGDDSIDEFLFDTRRGFCEHFASAFTMLMRAANIPARIVTGYHGGEYNALGDYLLVRQSDAHAWSEVWLEGRGWVRIDPTAAVAPQRVERDLSAAMGADEPVPGRFIRQVPMLASVRLAWDAVNNFWNNRIVEYDEMKQRSLMAALGIEDADWSDLGIAFSATLVAFFLAMSGYMFWRFQPRQRDPAARIYDALCRRLAKHRLPRKPHEGPSDYLNRIASIRPELTNTLGVIRDLYVKLRYFPESSPTEMQLLRRHVQRLSL